MACAEEERPNLPESDPTIDSTSEVKDHQEPQIPVSPSVEAVPESSVDVVDNQNREISVDDGVQTDVHSSTAAAGINIPKKPMEEKKMSKNLAGLPHELENQFILRLPLEHASTVRNLIHSRKVSMKDKLKIDISPDGRHTVVEIDGVSLSAKLVDLPCVIESLKTHDKKSFYKTADISQMLVCSAEGDVHSSPEEEVTFNNLSNKAEKKKKYAWKHGISPPLKNVQKKRFRKVKKKLPDMKPIEETSFNEFIDSLEVEKEVKRLLCSDAEAISTRWEVIADEETKEIESQGYVPGLPMSPGINNYRRDHSASEYDMLREMYSDSSSSNNYVEDNGNDKDEKDEDDEDDEVEWDECEEEEEEDSEEAIEKEIKAKFESGLYKAKEGAYSIVIEIHKQIYYIQKSLKKIQRKAQRQIDIIRKVENLTLKTHLYSVLGQLTVQEKEKRMQLIAFYKQLRYFVKKK